MRLRDFSAGLTILTLGAVFAACGGADDVDVRESGTTSEATTASSGDEAESLAPPADAGDSTPPFDELEPEILRGRVLHAESATPLDDVWVRLRRAGTTRWAHTDRRGYFHADGLLKDGRISVRVGLDREGPWFAPGALEVEHAAAKASETVHVLRVASGPGYRLDFLQAAADNPGLWAARLVERDADGHQRSWSWRDLRLGEVPRLRYAADEFPEQRSFHSHVELRLKGRDWFGRAPVRRVAGEWLEPVLIPLVQYTAFGGSLVDEEGGAVAGAEISFLQKTGASLPVQGAQWRSVWSAADGAFRLPLELEPGEYQFCIRSEGREPVRLTLSLAEGETLGRALRLPSAREGKGSLVVEVRGEEGDPSLVIVSLRSTGESGQRRILHTESPSDPKGRVELTGATQRFHFRGLLPGDYEVTLFPADGARYEPDRLDTSLPSENESGGEALVFQRRSGSPRLPLRFQVIDGRSEESLRRYQVGLSSPGWWYPLGRFVAAGDVFGSLPKDSPIGWTVFAEGYRPARGLLSEAREEEGGLVIDVALEPGWGGELILRDGSSVARLPNWDTRQQVGSVHQAPPVPGVEVHVDGVLVGVSDASGKLVFERDVAPERLELFKPGWSRLAGASGELVDLDDLALFREARTAVVWMMPDE